MPSPPKSPEQPDEQLHRYACADCGALIEPEYTWELESHGRGNATVLITHHCTRCLPDQWMFSRYRTVPPALDYLVGEHEALVRKLAWGGWHWENPVKLRFVSPNARDMVEIRELLENVNTPADFERLCQRRI